jgi:chromosome segregation ATPase
MSIEQLEKLIEELQSQMREATAQQDRIQLVKKELKSQLNSLLRERRALRRVENLSDEEREDVKNVLVEGAIATANGSGEVAN